jgi:hypothetical protein
MNCAEAEILICDYATLTSAERFELERHLGECPACAELARDSAAALRFIEIAGDVEVPPELVTRILFDAPWAKKAKPQGARRWLGVIFGPVLQPRFAMGMAMTILSLAMLAQFVRPLRQPTLSELEPKKLWAEVEGRAYRAWTRTVKFYDNLKFVYQIQTTLREWQQQNVEQQSAADSDASDRKADEKKLPVGTIPEQGATPGAAPAKDGTGGSH